MTVDCMKNFPQTGKFTKFGGSKSDIFRPDPLWSVKLVWRSIRCQPFLPRCQIWSLLVQCLQLRRRDCDSTAARLPFDAWQLRRGCNHCTSRTQWAYVGQYSKCNHFRTGPWSIRKIWSKSVRNILRYLEYEQTNTRTVIIALSHNLFLSGNTKNEPD